MIDLEERKAAQIFEAIGAAIEARAEQQDLTRAGVNGLAHEIVDKACAHDRGAACAGPSEIQEVGGEPAYGGQSSEIGKGFETTGQQGGGIGIFEQAARRRLGGFHGSEKRHVFGGAAGTGAGSKLIGHFAGTDGRLKAATAR
jgi:hypothetical protein